MRIFILFIVLLFSFGGFSQKSPDDFVFTVKTDNYGPTNDSAFTLKISPFIHLSPGVIQYLSVDIDWENDGLFDTLGVNSNITKQYDSIGVYTIRLRGVFPRLNFAYFTTKCLKLISVDQWGSQVWRDCSLMFLNCDSLKTLPSDTPNFSQVSDMTSMFENCMLMNEPLSHWDVSSIYDMGSMFAGAKSFNQPLDTWNVDSVQDMSRMFSGATAFNQPLDGWDVRRVTWTRSMFFGAINFNQPLINWDFQAIIDMSGMFSGATSFNQPLHHWNYGPLPGSPNNIPWNPLGNFLNNSGLSTANYDSLLIYLNQNYFYKRFTLGAVGLKYCAADSARAQMISGRWHINGDTYNCQSVGLNNNKRPDFYFFPNPAHSLLHFENLKGGEIIQIYNLQGQLLEELLCTNPSFSLDLRTYSNGVYFLKMGNSVRKFIVQK